MANRRLPRNRGIGWPQRRMIELVMGILCDDMNQKNFKYETVMADTPDTQAHDYTHECSF